MADAKTSPYAPIRMRQWPWYVAARRYAETQMLRPDGFAYQQSCGPLMVQIIDQTMSPALAEAGSSAQNQHALGDAASHSANLIAQAPIIALYHACGRQIFDLSDVLVDMLCHTDVSETSLAEWRPPYNGFYIRFGTREDLRIVRPPEVGGPVYVDGAFIGVQTEEDGAPVEIRIMLTTHSETGESIEDEPGYYVQLDEDDLRMPVAQGLEQGLERLKQFWGEWLNFDEVGRAIAQDWQDRIDASAQVLDRSSELLVNALYYIESVGRHGAVQQPGRDTPRELAKAWDEGAPAQRKSQRKRLLRDGYAMVYMMGREFEHGASHGGHGATKAAHWRRGHWRDQRHGPKLSQTKRIWIKPVAVGARDEQLEPAGHIYRAPRAAVEVGAHAGQ